MNEPYFDMIDRDELPDEPELEFDEPLEDLPEVWWAEDIASIENPMLREEVVEEAERIVDQEHQLEEMSKDGLLDGDGAIDWYREKLLPQKQRAATKAGLASVGLTYDHLGDLAEDHDFLTADDGRLAKLKSRLPGAIDNLGTNEAQELADRMLEEGAISEEAHKIISRQVKLKRLEVANDDT